MSLNPNQTIESVFRLSSPQKEGLLKLGLKNIKDLLLYLPSRYGEKAEFKHIDEIKNGELVIVSGKVNGTKIIKSWKTKIPMAEMTIEDDTGRLKAVWFHQPYIAKKFPEGSFVRMKGVANVKEKTRRMANPDIEMTDSVDLAHHGSLFSDGDFRSTPVYPETKGLSSLWFRHAIDRLLKNKVHEKIQDPIPREILEKYHLPSLQTALVWIHSPKKDSDAISARKRFAFEEVFYIQLERQEMKKAYESNPSFKIKAKEKDIQEFTDRFGFKMTKAQERSIKEIIEDMGENKPMMRLLEGDVGSGKTAVAATAAYTALKTSPTGKDFDHLQTAYMAPTEILANQHFESFIKYFTYTGTKIGLITGSGCKKYPSKSDPKLPTNISRSQLLKWVSGGEISVLVGTHSLIQKTVKFKHLGLVIIDEQHRFGVSQRSELAKKGYGEEKKPVPHLLSMTATPIPRTLALTIYGDLDLTLLDEMPAGRKTIITEIIAAKDRNETYEKIRNELKKGRQAYIICPRIDEPDPNKELALNARSVKTEAERLKKDVFKEYNIGILHGKITPTEKEKVMKDFLDKKIDILVATSVIEVGVNVPNATVILIEGGDRFGLSQLHQLRGRVLRSEHQSYCFILSDSQNGKTLERLKAIKNAKNGFELAELDLNLRGFGELSGKKQWGISDIGMEAIKNIKMVEAARNEAKKIVEADQNEKNIFSLKEKMNKERRLIHME